MRTNTAGDHEIVMLLEVKADGLLLVLGDERTLSINPADAPTACTWLPSAELEIWDTEDAEFSLRVRNVDDEVCAAWAE